MTKDILKALDAEKSYLEHKLNGDNSIVLYDEIIKCGFDSLDDYFDAKKRYQIKCLDFALVEQPPEKCIQEFWNCVSTKTTELCLVETLAPTVYTCTSKPYNKEFCQENNIAIVEVPSGGGTIVSNVGDMAIAIGIPATLNIYGDFLLREIASILEKYMDNVNVVDNDILVNNKKVCGTTTIRQNDMIVCFAHFSFCDNSELIKSICYVDRNTQKIPYFMTGLNKEAFKEEVVKWLIST